MIFHPLRMYIFPPDGGYWERRMMCVREEKKPVPVRRVYAPRGERLERLMVRYLSDGRS